MKFSDQWPLDLRVEVLALDGTTIKGAIAAPPVLIPDPCSPGISEVLLVVRLDDTLWAEGRKLAIAMILVHSNNLTREDEES